MPSRVLRESYLDSERMRQAGELAEVLFVRLLLVADDFGRFDGRMSVICRRCWPLGGPTEEDAADRLDALARVGVIVTYTVDGKPFIFIPNFKQRTRSTHSKYPEPSKQCQTDAGQLADKSPSEAGQVTAVGARSRSSGFEVDIRSSKSGNGLEEPPNPNTPAQRSTTAPVRKPPPGGVKSFFDAAIGKVPRAPAEERFADEEPPLAAGGAT